MELVKNTIRQVDFFARWGGEEFIILLPSTSKSNATELTERIQRLIEGSSFYGYERITCSFGITNLTEADDFNSFVQRADQLLYKAKNVGKNVVVCS